MTSVLVSTATARGKLPELNGVKFINRISGRNAFLKYAKKHFDCFWLDVHGSDPALIPERSASWGLSTTMADWCTSLRRSYLIGIEVRSDAKGMLGRKFMQAVAEYTGRPLVETPLQASVAQGSCSYLCYLSVSNREAAAKPSTGEDSVCLWSCLAARYGMHLDQAPRTASLHSNRTSKTHTRLNELPSKPHGQDQYESTKKGAFRILQAWHLLQVSIFASGNRYEGSWDNGRINGH